MSARVSLRDERGLILATVLVFLVVLLLSAFYVAAVTRTDIQVVSNLQDEKKAFHIAEAGVAEALVRLGMTKATSVTVNGSAFDASFTGAYSPDPGQPSWKAQILFDGSVVAPTKTGNTVSAPSIQPAATRLAYSTNSAGTDALTLAWDLCPAAGVGCASAGAIRQAKGSNVLNIISTGQSGVARRKVTQQVLFDKLSAVVLRDDVCPGVRTQGSGAVAFPSGVQINSTCGTAISAGGSSSISAGGPITTSGSGYSGNVTPTPSTGAPRLPDPLAGLPVPSFAGRPVRSGLAAAPVTFQTSGTQTIQPGIYYGGLSIRSGSVTTMAPGVYVMAGGGFTVAANGQVTSDANGVMIYNTCAIPPAAGIICTLGGIAGYGAISISASRPLRMTAQTADVDPTYAGIVFFQDRLNTQPISVTAGATGLIDGLIYAPNATITMGGNADLLHSQLLVGAIDLQGGPTIGEPSFWVPIGGNGAAKLLAWLDF